MIKKRKLFGTDGIRGHVGEFPITPEFVLKLGWAVGCTIANGKHGKVLIGKDTRISGYMFESALEAGLSAAGVNIYLLGPTPTPAISYLTHKLEMDAGIVISASHNPYSDNGIKFFYKDGLKLPDDIELLIERKLETTMRTVASKHLGKATRIEHKIADYIAFCKSTLPKNISLNGLKVVIDCANGATYHIAPDIFRELGAKVITIADEPDGFNINSKCGATQPENLSKAVIIHKANLGIALDGDGDRAIMVDHQGNILDGDDLLFIIASNLKQHGRLGSGVVGTSMSNLGLELAIRDLGVNFVRSKVGDRYVFDALRSNKWFLGGEPSGHIINLDLLNTGDGIISALQVLHAMCYNEKCLKELSDKLKKFPQKLINVKISSNIDLEKNSKIQREVNLIKQKLKNHGRIVLRKSGTEPVVRVMIESDNKELSNKLAQQLANTISSATN